MNQFQSQKKSSSRQRRPYRLTGPIILLVILLFLMLIQSSPKLRKTVLGLVRPVETTGMTSVGESGQTTEPQATASQTESVDESEPTPIPTAPALFDEPVTLAAVGDIILHQAVIDGGLTDNDDQGQKNYDFTPAFQYVAPIIQAADLSICNFEGTLAGPPFTGFPLFSAPDAIADALYTAGFRAAWTANNHILDKGLDGLLRTTRILQDKNLQVIGTRLDQTQQSDAVVNVQGYQIGLIAYTFETIGTETQPALNSVPIPEDAIPLLDSFNPYRSEIYEQNLKNIAERAVVLRQKGAEMICLSLHWGDEYKTKESDYQRKMAQRLADEGIELIIGHHPHVLQPIDVLTAENLESRTLVFYSIGNFLHNMTFSTHGTNGYAQDAMIARVTIQRTGGRVQATGAEIIPTYVTRKQTSQGLRHYIVPVLSALDDPASYQSQASDIKASWQRIQTVLQSSVREDQIPVSFSP